MEHIITEKKIIVIGCPGSGKSYFSQMLSKKTGIPKYHLDCIYWKENWIPVDKEEFIEKTNEIMKKDEWIIDGNYKSTLENRMKNCQLVFHLDVPKRICLKGYKERRGKKREDIPDYLIEEYDPEFVRYIKNFRKEQRLITISLIKKYSNLKVITFKSRRSINKYLNNLNNKINI